MTTTLFGDDEPDEPFITPLPPIARGTDPATSHAAGDALTASGERQRMMDRTLAGLRQWPGCTAKELERRLGCEDGAVRKRLNDLRNLRPALARVGEDRVCSITGRTAQTWYGV